MGQQVFVPNGGGGINGGSPTGQLSTAPYLAALSGWITPLTSPPTRLSKKPWAR